MRPNYYTWIPVKRPLNMWRQDIYRYLKLDPSERIKSQRAWVGGWIRRKVMVCRLEEMLGFLAKAIFFGKSGILTLTIIRYFTTAITKAQGSLLWETLHGPRVSYADRTLAFNNWALINCMNTTTTWRKKKHFSWSVIAERCRCRSHQFFKIQTVSNHSVPSSPNDNVSHNTVIKATTCRARNMNKGWDFLKKIMESHILSEDELEWMEEEKDKRKYAGRDLIVTEYLIGDHTLGQALKKWNV